jgi:hypothetical protein
MDSLTLWKCKAVAFLVEHYDGKVSGTLREAKQGETSKYFIPVKSIHGFPRRRLRVRGNILDKPMLLHHRFNGSYGA